MKPNLRNKKTQIELIGLIVIVIIVVIGILIFMIYQFNSAQESMKKRYMDKGLAANLLISMMNTDVAECHNQSLWILLSDCSEHYHSITCNDKTSCEAANDTVMLILNRTLVDWDVSFNFSVEKTGINFVYKDCDSRKNKERSFHVIGAEPDRTEVILDICE